MLVDIGRKLIRDQYVYFEEEFGMVFVRGLLEITLGNQMKEKASMAPSSSTSDITK